MSAQKQVASTLLAAWLADNHPDVFQNLAIMGNPTGAPVSVNLAPPGLAGFTDTLSSIWGSVTSAASTVASGLSTAVQSVGNFLATPGGQSALQAIALAKYGNASAPSSVIQTQLARADAGQTPAPIQTVYDPRTGTYVPVLTQTNQAGQTYQTPLTPYALSSLQPSFIDKYGMWIAGGALALVGFSLVLRRN